MSFLSRGILAHWMRLLRLEGQWIVYNSAGRWVRVKAVAGRSVSEDVPHDGDGIVTTRTDDWILLADDLRLVDADAGTNDRHTPRRGDSVKTEAGALYDVLPGRNGQTWNFMDTGHQLIRIHSVARS